MNKTIAVILLMLPALAACGGTETVVQEMTYPFHGTDITMGEVLDDREVCGEIRWIEQEAGNATIVTYRCIYDDAEEVYNDLGVAADQVEQYFRWKVSGDKATYLDGGVVVWPTGSDKPMGFGFTGRLVVGHVFEDARRAEFEDFTVEMAKRSYMPPLDALRLRIARLNN